MLRLKLLMIKNLLFYEIKYSKLKVFTVFSFTILLLFGEFRLFYYLFSFLGRIHGVGLIIIEKLFFLFFMSIFFLLVFSNIIVSYSSIFTSKELSILFSYPLRYLNIFDLKFIESTFLSSWAFFFVAFPFIIAFGIYKDLGLLFHIISFIYLIPFIVIASILGNFTAFFLGKFLNKKLFKAFLITLLGSCVVFLILYAKTRIDVSPFEHKDLIFMLGNLMPHFKISQSPLLPSYWLSNGLLLFSWSKFSDSIFYLLFLISNCLLGILLLKFLAYRIYYKTWENIKSNQTTTRRNIQFRITKTIDTILNKLSYQKSAFINKDLKLFIRTPSQWGQGLMFFGLLAVYFGNLENLSYNLVAGYWKNVILFLNMMATSLALASLCVRFVFPQLSLEGNKAWLLKLAPVSLKKILVEKFLSSLILAIIIAEGLIFLSNYMLEVEKPIFYISFGIIAMICFALVGLSCGLGAIFPNFKQDNPTVIVSGMGGTLNFIFSLTYLGLVIWILAPVVYNYIINQSIVLPGMFIRLCICIGAIFILSCIAGSIPIYLGIKHLENIEF